MLEIKILEKYYDSVFRSIVEKKLRIIPVILCPDKKYRDTLMNSQIYGKEPFKNHILLLKNGDIVGQKIMITCKDEAIIIKANSIINFDGSLLRSQERIYTTDLLPCTEDIFSVLYILKINMTENEIVNFMNNIKDYEYSYQFKIKNKNSADEEIRSLELWFYKKVSSRISFCRDISDWYCEPIRMSFYSDISDYYCGLIGAEQFGAEQFQLLSFDFVQKVDKVDEEHKCIIQ